MDFIFMKKKLFFIFFIFIISALFIYSEDKKIRPTFIFTGTQGFTGIIEGSKAGFLNLEHDIFLGFELPISFYTLGISTEDSLIFDFADMQEKNTFQRMINNTFTAGIDNTFFFKNKVYANINFYVNYVLPFNQFKINNNAGYDLPYLILNPIMIIGGMYYFGLDWEMEEDLPVKLIFNSDMSSFKPTTSISLNFEFFRFYGPENFHFSIITNDSFTFSIPLQNFNAASQRQTVTFLNNLNAGVSFDFYGMCLTLGFLNNIIYDLNSSKPISNEIGFKTDSSYTLKIFTFTASYSGYMAYSDNNAKWTSNFNLCWGISFSSIDLIKNKK
jgi:hypothetical protein